MFKRKALLIAQQDVSLSKFDWLIKFQVRLYYPKRVGLEKRLKINLYHAQKLITLAILLHLYQ